MTSSNIERWFVQPLRRSTTIFLACATLGAVSVLLAGAAMGQTYTVLHTFTMPEGIASMGGLVRDRAGNLYGTTSFGGPRDAQGGTVFKVDTSGVLTVLHTFRAFSGPSYPTAGLTVDKRGGLVGTTSRATQFGWANAFRVSLSKRFQVIANFASPWGSCNVDHPLVQDAAGYFLGTGQCAESSAWGSVFRLDGIGGIEYLYAFSGGSDGRAPDGAPLLDASGNVYGTTLWGGDLTCNPPDGCGVIFMLSSTYVYTVLHSFSATEGYSPRGGVLADDLGNLYGTTSAGGAYGYGTIFQLSPSGEYVVLHDFTSSDGINPLGTLLRDPAGNLYGLAINGGAFDGGTVYKLDNAGGFSVLYNFTGGSDGAWPHAPMVMDANGNLYGTNQLGGDPSSNGGVVFKISF